MILVNVINIFIENTQQKKCNERIAYGFILLSVIDLLSTIDFALKGDVFWSILSFVAFVLCGVYSVYLVAKVFNKGENK